MTDSTQNDWETTEKSGLVSIGDRKLFLSVSGPVREPGDAIVIFIHALGGTIKTWPTVSRLISGFARNILFDRTGQGLSEHYPSEPIPPRNGVNMGLELTALLKATKIPGPYVLVASSYGGILAREFAEQRLSDIVGLVLIDTNQERTYIERPIDYPSYMTMTSGIDYYAVTGCEKNHKLTPEEWKALKSQEDSPYSMLEFEEMDRSADTLAAHKQFERQVLGDHPVAVIKGNTAREMQKMYEAVVEKGNGTQEQRDKLKEFVENLDPVEERLQREQLRLSSNTHFVYAKNSGHHPHLTEPELVAAEIRWIFASNRGEKSLP